MPDGSEFHTAAAATLKPREAKVVRTRGADNRLVFVDRVWECGDYEGSGGEQAEWSRECCGSAWQV